MTFQYKGISQNGTGVSGVIKATNELEATTQLREKLSVITSITKVDSGLNKDLFSGKAKKVKDKDIAVLCSQFSIVLKAGLSITKCVEMLAAQTKDATLKAILVDVAVDLGNGQTLADSFKAHGGSSLPITFIETVRAGEAAGTLDSCFERLHVFYDKASKNKGKVSGALTYPIIVIVVAVVVFFIIMLKAVPLFTSTFEEMGVELPGVTKALMAMSDFTINWWWLILAVGLILFIAFKVYTGSEDGKLKYARWRFTTAPMHDISLMGAAEQFISTFATMLSAGLNVLEALDVCGNVVSNYAFSQAVKKVRDGVERGRRMVDCMREEPDLFPEMMTEMTGVGEEAGTLEETLSVVADYYGNEVDLATGRLLAVMEPAITIGLAVIVCILLLAVYLPMFSMYGSVNV